MSLAEIEARVKAKGRARSIAAKPSAVAAAERARRNANLKAEGVVIPLSKWLGHNNGPPINVDTLYLEFCWRQAHEAAWKAPNHDVALLRARWAAEAGVSYHQYTLEILERGKHLPPASIEKD